MYCHSQRCAHGGTDWTMPGGGAIHIDVRKPVVVGYSHFHLLISPVVLKALPASGGLRGYQSLVKLCLWLMRAWALRLRYKLKPR
jgi:hypothetical protein